MKLNEDEQLEQRVRENADLLAGIVGSAMDAIVATDDAQRVVLFNAAAEKIFACPANEAIGGPVERFIPQRFRAGHGTRVRRFADSGATNRTLHGLGTLWGLRANGEEFPIEASISKVECGGKKFFTAVIRDITERHCAEAAVRESEQRFRLVADTAPVLMWMSGTDKLCTYFNKTWLDFTGRSMQEELGNGWAEGVHPEDLQRCLDTYAQSFDRQENFRMEYRLRRHDGEYRWVLDVGVPRFNLDVGFVGYIGVCIDITERKLAEQERLLSEHRFRQFFETMPEYSYMVSPNGEIMDANLAACSAFGYTKDELVGKPLSTLYAPECQPKMHDLFTKWKTHGKLRNEEMVVITKEGQRRIVLLNVGSVKDANGSILHSTSVQVDITERKMSEERLRESEEQFRTLAEAIPQLCWMTRGDGHIFWYNERWYRYTGTTPEQMEGWGWQSVHDPQALPSVLKQWKESISTGEPFDMVFPLRGADGIFRPFLTRITPIKDADGRVVRWFGTNTDITELRDAQEALRTSEERMRLAQKVARIGSFEWNMQTGVNIWTPELEAMYGLPPGGFGGTQSAFEKLVHPDDLPMVLKLANEALETGRPMQAEWRVVWTDGSVHWIAGRWQALMNESGRPSRVVGVNIDITERKQAEEALSGMTRKLVEAQEQERTRIARDLHDDVTQRLVMLSIEIDEVPNYLVEKPSEVKDWAHGLSGRARDIASDIQSLSRELHSSALEYLGLEAGMKSWCIEFSERHNLEISFQSRDVPQPSREISLCLFRVLQEALQNAAKHSGAKRMEVQLAEDTNEIHLFVSDSGTGFDIKVPGRSRGLGLTSMQERVRLVGGTIAIDSMPDAGTTIHVCVPLRTENQARPDKPDL
jgi:PAS domain S-box-containing protein